MPGLLQRAIGGFLEGAGQGSADANMVQMRSDVELEKQKAIEDYKVDSANRQREALASRVDDASKGFLQQAVASNANRKFDYTDEEGNSSPASFDELPDEDRVDPSFQPTSKQVLQARIQAAMKTGDYAHAAELTKLADAGHVSVGYGSKVIDQNDIDPETGLPRVIVDNSLDRAENAKSNSQSRRITADASSKRADAAAVKAASPGGSYDKTLTSINQSIKSQTSIMNSAQNAVSTAPKAERPALQERVNQAAAAIKDLEAQASARRAQLAAQKPASQSSSSGDTDYSSLWK
jgi:hypothetical protein